METLLSVIIPCYNSSQYIEESLTSVLDYMPITCELIIVNDGSTDDTLEKIKIISEKHPTKRIKTLTQENLGVSAARNNGINASTGKYIAFLDSDDYYYPLFWELFPNILEYSDYDIYEFNACQFNIADNKNKTLNIVSFDNEVCFNNVSQRTPAFRNSQWFPWARVYNANLFKSHKIKFPENYHYEDMYTIPQVYLASKSVFPIKNNLVYYRTNESSISQTFRKKDILDLICILEKYKSLSMATDKYQDIRKVLYPAAKRIFDLIKYLMISRKNFDVGIVNIIRLQKVLIYFSQEFPSHKRLAIYLFPLYFKLILSFRKK
ncbi:heptose III glucuronosyltransferase [Izhakiella capsodis]|uniref:Heptose III glucuronosyltransferase n=1 Tax=Izhakiella capsodis TaxID=1367852 RepID=A0A1I4X2J4_9GAMM|nr:glycosyltransferase [Izhakiella capsodis]SFN19852.1 heptose III glucuronosyltransferase [Izhakiella capsodis]